MPKCPECNSNNTAELGWSDEFKKMNMRCNECGHEWKHLH